MSTLYLEEQAAPSTPASGKVVVYPKTDGNLYQMDDAGTEKLVAGVTILATQQNSTSGSEIDFTGLPTWVKHITVMLNGVSLSGTDQVLVQIGDTDGVETTSYTSSYSLSTGGGTSQGTSTAGLIIPLGDAAQTTIAVVYINLMNASTNTWLFSSTSVRSDGNAAFSVGIKSLSATLDRVRVDTSGTNTFDAGTINISYTP